MTFKKALQAQLFNYAAFLIGYIVAYAIFRSANMPYISLEFFLGFSIVYIFLGAYLRYRFG